MISDKELLAALEASEVTGERLAIKVGHIAVEGGFNAVLVLPDGSSAQFSLPVFKHKRKAINYAHRKAAELIEHISKRVAQLGYGVEVSNR